MYNAFQKLSYGQKKNNKKPDRQYNHINKKLV